MGRYQIGNSNVAYYVVDTQLQPRKITGIYYYNDPLSRKQSYELAKKERDEKNAEGEWR